MPETLDVIAFAAHPDDAEASCGGLLSKLARLGYRVAICDLTRGELGSNGTLEERAQEAGEAARVLGLDVAGVDLLEAEAAPKVMEVNSSPGFEGLERATGLDIAGAIVEYAAGLAARSHRAVGS